MRHTRPKSSALFIFIIAALLLAMQPTTPARAIGVIAVQSVADTDDPSKDACTLREALQGIFNAQNAGQAQTYHECASADPSINIITIGVPGTISLANTLPGIKTNVTITGPVIINGNNNVIFRVLDGAIFNFAALSLTKGNPAILVTGDSPKMNIAGSSFTGNANDHGNGGAIDGRGMINIVGTNFTGNSSTDKGGAINVAGTDKLTIAGSVFNGNIAKHSGGAIYATAPVNILDSVFNGNIAKGDDPNNDGKDDSNDDYTAVGGGALYSMNDGTDGRKMALTRDIFNGNLTPKGNGGALFNGSNAVVEISKSSFNGNLAGTPPTTNRQAGAINNLDGKVTISQSVLLNNGVVGNGGAIANDRNATLALTNVELIANAATGNGGGLHNVNTQNGSSIRPQATLLNTTLNLNVGVQGGGGLFNEDGATDKLILGNTIVAGSDGAVLGGNCAGGTFTSQGHNLDSGTSCALAGSGDLSSADSKLQAPSFNGGAVATLLTEKIGVGSAAIDAGDNAICAAEPVNNEDVRGDSRPKGAACDIGAFEATPVVAGYGSTPVQPGPIPVGSATVGTLVSTNFSIYETGDGTLNVSDPQLNGTNAGEFAVTSGLPASILDGGAAQAVAISCTPAAVGPRTATLTLTTNDPAHASVSYSLLCVGTAVPQPAFASVPAAPGPVDFGTVTVGQIKNGVLNVQEAGNAPLTVNTPVLGGLNPGDFSFGGSVDLNLPDGQPPVAIALSCTPTAPGIRTATLTLSTNDPAKATVIFNLTCKGVQPPAPVLAGPGVSIGNSLTNGNNGPYGLAISPDGKHVYTADDGDSIVTVFGRNVSGNLVFQDGVIDGQGGATELGGSIIPLVSADGKNVYVASNADDAVTTFVRNPETGALTFVDRVKNNDISGFCSPPICTHLNALDGAYGLALSPDGRFIYISSINDSKITVLNRDPDTGGIAIGIFKYPVQVYASADLSAAYGIAISPDGTHLYATGYGSDTLLVFNRNATNGTLTLAQKLGVADVASLNGVFRVTVSPDGAYVYTASFDSNSVTTFKRNPADGKLTNIATYTNGVGGVDGIGYASSVTVSPDGGYLFATGYSSNGVAVFVRDTTTGLLTFSQAIKRDANGQPPLASARDVVVAPDGRMIFVSSHDDNRVVSIPLSNPAPTFVSLNPASTLVGGPAFTLTVNGQAFVNGATVQWGGAARPTTFINSGKLQVHISAADIASVGTINVAVANPAPGGGISNALAFTVSAPNDNPTPSITSINPQGATAGGPAILLTVTGANFMTASQAQWNGAARPTTFVSPTTLQVQIGAADVAQPGQAGVTVVNPAPGGGTSNAVSFNIAAPGTNPPPSITSLTPPSVIANTANGDLTLVVHGANFIDGARAQWNGASRPTTFVSATEVHASISGTDLIAPGTASVTVVNPAPGGGISNVATFTIGAVGDNPVPVLTHATISIGATQIASDGLQVTLTGEGFTTGATVLWNGVAYQPTSFSPTQIVVNIPSSEYRTAVLTVVNPAPGGGTSNELLFSVMRVYLPVVMR